MPEEALSGCPAENDIMKNRGLSYERKYYCGHCLRGSCPLCHRDVSQLSEGRKLTVQVFRVGTLAEASSRRFYSSARSVLIAGTLMMKKKISGASRCGHQEQAILLHFRGDPAGLHVELFVHGWIHHPVCDHAVLRSAIWFHGGAVWKNAVISIAVIPLIYYVFKRISLNRTGPGF